MAIDPVTASLIFNGLIKTIETYSRIEAANGGLTDEQRSARRQARKDALAFAKSIPADYEFGDDLPSRSDGG